MDKSSRSQEHIQKAFSSYCTKVLKNETVDALKNVKHKNKHICEVFIDDLPLEESMTYAYDNYSSDDTDGNEKLYSVAGKNISSSMITEALDSLSEEWKNLILQYYFHNKTDLQIAEMLDVSRSTIQYRRNLCIKRVKKYLEEYTDEKRHK